MDAQSIGAVLACTVLFVVDAQSVQDDCDTLVGLNGGQTFVGSTATGWSCYTNLDTAASYADHVQACQSLDSMSVWPTAGMRLAWLNTAAKHNLVITALPVDEGRMIGLRCFADEADCFEDGIRKGHYWTLDTSKDQSIGSTDYVHS